MEKRIYLVDVYNYEFDTVPTTWNDEKFISESEIQGNVYSLEGFVKHFNAKAIDSLESYIRII